MVPSLCTHYNYSFNWGEKGDPAHALHLSYIPVLYIPASSTASRRALHRHRQHQQRRGRERTKCANHRLGESALSIVPGKKESPEGYRDETSRVLDALTSNSLHTESWLHLSHAIQALNDDPGNKKRKGGEKRKKRRKSS